MYRERPGIEVLSFVEVTSVLLEQISSPQDIRRMDPAQLAQLAEEIRAFVVDAVNASPSGRHLGSNLGVVELTLALHRSFHSPHDVILWDTGHQAYVHKLLTGRREGFSTLRQAGGMSGYPSRAESEHDWIENSHASTVLSYAQGMATALELSGGPKRHVVAVVGDGAMTGGMAFEGLNNLGHSGRRVITILNDNGRSYAPTASRLGDSLVKLRAHPMYRRNTARIERVVRDLPGGEVLGRGWDSATHALRDMFEPPAFFEDLGVAYLGPLDGHDIDALERALAAAKEMDGPVVVHVLTQKGRGYAPAENDSVKHLHDMGSVKPGSYTGAFSEAIVAEAEARPELVALTAAMPDSTGLLPMMERFPDRVFDVGIAEQHAVTSAAGMAMMGLRPVFAVYSTFLTRAIDQVRRPGGHQVDQVGGASGSSRPGRFRPVRPVCTRRRGRRGVPDRRRQDARRCARGRRPPRGRRGPLHGLGPARGQTARRRDVGRRRSAPPGRHDRGRRTRGWRRIGDRRLPARPGSGRGSRCAGARRPGRLPAPRGGRRHPGRPGPRLRRGCRRGERLAQRQGQPDQLNRGSAVVDVRPWVARPEVAVAGPIWRTVDVFGIGGGRRLAQGVEHHLRCRRLTKSADPTDGDRDGTLTIDDERHAPAVTAQP